MSRMLSATLVDRLIDRLRDATARADWREVDAVREALSRPDRPAMGFYEIQAVQVACWDARDAGQQDLPMLPATKVLEMVEEIWRLRGIVVDMQSLTEAALPDHTERRTDSAQSATKGDGA